MQCQAALVPTLGLEALSCQLHPYSRASSRADASVSGHQAELGSTSHRKHTLICEAALLGTQLSFSPRYLS